MELDFNSFQKAVHDHFRQMVINGPLFRVDATKENMIACYLNSFPDGTNPIYKERTFHDCNCCRSFIRDVGNVVGVKDNKLVTIWDCNIPDPTYQKVAESMAEFIKTFKIVKPFHHFTKTIGTPLSLTLDNKWDHFYCEIPILNRNTRQILTTKDNMDRIVGESVTSKQTFMRAMDEIKTDALNTVLELINDNALYRGEQNKKTIEAFLELKKDFDISPDKELFSWVKSVSVPTSLTHIRNSSIGTLLINLSEGMNEEGAVRAYEAITAPQNYKRPTALVTTKMVENARITLADMGLTTALDRRFATIDDISVNDVLYVDRNAKPQAFKDVFDKISGAIPVSEKNSSKEISIEEFIAKIVPKAKSMELLVEKTHEGNLVSLIAPVDNTLPPIFSWNNNISWSYNGDVTDSIKEKVQKKGGNITGDLCCRLAWYNFSDYDFHMKEPQDNIYYGNKLSSNGGRLDVDENAGYGVTQTPVENIFYATKNTMKDGDYTLSVHNFALRDYNDTAFDVEVEFQGVTHSFHYDGPFPNDKMIKVCTIHYKKGEFSLTTHLKSTIGEAKPSQFWNLTTETYKRVTSLMLSPNYWGENGSGNKHYFFMVEDCINNGNPRGIYNEFLRGDLTPHRKVFEIVGKNCKVASSDKQLSGFGFSSTLRNKISVKVSDGNKTTPYTVTF